MHINEALDNALTKAANFVSFFQNVYFYVVEYLPGQGLLQRILQRDEILMNGKDRVNTPS